jgi:hypothetical protein
MEEKYAVVFTGTGEDKVATVFDGRADALGFATEKRLEGITDIELFKSLGVVQFKSVVESEGNGVQKPKRMAAKSPEVKKVTTKKAKTGRRFPKQCIVPGCRKKNKGPRFSFLCDDHAGASKKQIVKWKEG